MVQWLGELANLQRTQVYFPEPTQWLITIYNSSSRGFHAFFWPSWAQTCTYIHSGKTLTYAK